VIPLLILSSLSLLPNVAICAPFSPRPYIVNEAFNNINDKYQQNVYFDIDNNKRTV
jgi:hypothetical protein